MIVKCLDCGDEMESRAPLQEICEACRRSYQDEGAKFRNYRADRNYHRNEGMNGTSTEGD
jgi:hypothetical protein